MGSRGRGNFTCKHFQDLASLESTDLHPPGQVILSKSQKLAKYKTKDVVLHLDCSPRHPEGVWVDIGFICSLPEMSLPANQIEGMGS